MYFQILKTIKIHAMKRQFVMMLAVFFACPLYLDAQVGKLMSRYHEQPGVTVTQLDKSLYGLYQRDNLLPEASEMLQKIDEVNIFSVNLVACEAGTADKAAGQFRGLLDDAGKYKLIKSRNDDFGKQLIYTRSQDGKVSDLVVWNENPQQLDVIELRGDIQLEKVALLSRALTIPGLNSLASLSSNPAPYEAYRRSNDFDGSDILGQLRKMQERMMQHFNGMGGMDRASDVPVDSTQTAAPMPGFFDPFGAIEDIFGAESMMNPQQIEELFKNGVGSQSFEKIFRSFGDGTDVISNSVQITEENGKTKIKIDSQNADITYIIDGKQAPKDNIEMPEQILNVNIIPSKEDVKKSYLFITSKEKIGTFVSCKDGVLTFECENQEYKYNLDKAQEPLLVIDGRLSSHFDLDPSAILQIRPVSQIEKEVGYYPNAEVIIYTR